MAVTVALLLAGCALPGTGPQAPTYPSEIVGGAPWTDLVVEIDHAPGHAPGEAATTHLISTLRNITAKTNVILDVAQTLNDTPGKSWTSEELRALEVSTRRHTHEAPHALLHVLYPSGAFNVSGVAGVTISGRALGPITIFLDTLRDSSCTPAIGPLPRIGLPLPQPAQALDVLERSTLLHESGHALGLVDNGLSMVRDHEDHKNDPAGGGHSANAKSVMYYQLDTCNGLRQFFTQDGSIPDAFDNDDRADVKAAGGK